ncbi:hypothetical protein LEP3755_34850 [Leptolyngbya sp. NIES-3755]|nr:hypothetical protein LEP3755_34850 [Leptolyngbya sp. NIES-3755]
MVEEKFCFNAKGIEVECVVYRNSASDLVCRFSTNSFRDIGPSGDGYYPPPDFGMLWCRIYNQRWVVSGMLAETIVDNEDEIDTLIDLIDTRIVKDGCLYQHHLIEIVRTQASNFSSGEEGGFIPEAGMSLMYKAID